MNTTQTMNSTSKPTILLAEDDVDQSDMLRERLEADGYAVDTVFSGDVAFRCLREKNYTAAILDARMPGLHGGTVLKACRALDGAQKIPVIMVSAFATPEDIVKYRCDGAIASFSKPINVPQFMRFLRNVVETREIT